MILNKVLKNINNDVTIEAVSHSPINGVEIEEGAIYIGYAWNKTYGSTSAYLKNGICYTCKSNSNLYFTKGSGKFKASGISLADGVIFKITFN